MKLTLKLLILILCCYGTARFCHHQTSGFKISKISGNYLEKIDFLEEPVTEKEDALLKGKFTYFGRGLQSFAFLSEDGTYVLKIFNNRMQKKEIFFKTFGFDNHAQKIKTKLELTFESYKIADKELKQETGILYTHLKPTSTLQRTVTLIDKLGIQHSLDLDQTSFVLQKRAILAYPYLKNLIENGKLLEAKAAITALTHLFVQKSLKGIKDNDPLIRTNLGFIDHKPIHIDIGPFSKDPKVQDPKFYLPEIRRITASLKHFLENNCPELISHLENELKNVEENS